MRYDRALRDRIKRKAILFRRKTTTAEYYLRCFLKNNSEKRVLRQCIVGNCIVDLGLPYRNLLIEVEGGSHLGREYRDRRRELWFKKLGFNVIRVTNEKVFTNRQEILAQVKAFPQSDENRKKFYMSVRMSKIISHWKE